MILDAKKTLVQINSGFWTCFFSRSVLIYTTHSVSHNRVNNQVHPRLGHNSWWNTPLPDSGWVTLKLPLCWVNRLWRMASKPKPKVWDRKPVNDQPCLAVQLYSPVVVQKLTGRSRDGNQVSWIIISCFKHKSTFFFPFLTAKLSFRVPL